MPRRAAVLAVIGAWWIGAGSAHGDTFTVSATGDTGTGSLRQAVSDANASAATDNTILFSLPASSTIMLGSDLEALESPTLTFSNTTNAVIIDGNDAILFQNASTAHDFTFSNLVTYRDGKLVFTEATDGTIDGILNGTDVQLSKAGTGTTTLQSGATITLDAASSVTIGEGTFAVLGTLSSPGTFTVDAPAILVIGNGGSVTTGAVTDQGTINVNSGGVFTITNSLLVAPGGALFVDGTVNAAGRTITSNGDLVANGSITAGSLVIGSGGVLTGSSTSINAPLTVSGRVAPSTSAGTLGVTGPVSFGSTSIYEVDMGPGNVGDSLTATGAVTISPGARLVLVADPATFALGSPSTKTVLSGSSLTGQFKETDYAFFAESFDYQPGALQITLTRTAQTFAPFAQTPNQRAVAQALDAAAPTASPDLQEALDALNGSQADEIAPLLDAIGGESLTAFATARQILAERTARALHRRVRDPMWGRGRAFYQSAHDEIDVAAEGGEETLPEEAPPELLRAGTWLDLLGLSGELDGETGEAEVDTLLYGGTLGGDAWIAERVVVGLAAGYARSDVDLDHRDADVFGDTVQGALYAGFVDPRGYVSAYGRYAYTFEHSRREIESSTLSRRARARWDAQDYGAGGEAGVTVLSLGGMALQPIAGVDWLRMTEDSYTERGAGDLGLDVDPDTLESTTARFGARVFGRFDMGGDTGTLMPELRAFYQHLYGDRERVLDARLVGAPGLGEVGVRGAELPRENLLVGVGWGVLVGENLTVSLDYDAMFGSERVEHQGTIAARVAF